MSDALTKMRADPRLKKPESRTIDRQDRVEATSSADARKAREVVRKLCTGSLPLIAQAVARVTGDLGVKHALQEAFDRFAVANDAYLREELKPRDRLIEWMGVGHGVMPPLPPGSPAHKVELAAAWNAMLALVNEATKVGIHKPHREHPIMLKVDLETENTPALIVPGSMEWN